MKEKNILISIFHSSKRMVTQCASLLLLYLIQFTAIDFRVSAQDTYIPKGSDEYHWVEKAESKVNQALPFSTTIQPLSRRNAALILSEYKEMRQMDLNAINNPTLLFQIDNLLSKNIEWTEPNIDGEYGKPSKKPLLKYFYKTPANFYQYENDDIFLSFNPVIYTQLGMEQGNKNYSFIFSRGAEMRARLWNKIGVYTFLTEHQERMPSYALEVADRWKRAFPGHDYYSRSSSKVNDAMIARGYIDFPLYKDFVKVTLGYDKHFIGDGIRSLWLSDFGAPYTFARINYNIGKWQYQNLFMELQHDYYGALDKRIPAKYAAMHYLTTQIGNKWRIGIFESTILNSDNQFKIPILNPIIGVNTAMQGNGNHKSAMGINIKGLLYPGLVFYGQSYVNSIDFSTFKEGGWKNQYALQGGLKYYDAFTLQNLDLQAEVNAVRPFVYAGLNNINTNYTHNNQPLAHPLESGFYEAILHLKYLPIKRLHIDARLMYVQSSVDSIGLNQGSSIFNTLNTRSADIGFSLINKNFKTQIFAHLHIAYEWKPNIYIEAGMNYLNRKGNVAITNPNSLNAYAGLRMNMTRRVYDWF